MAQRLVVMAVRIQDIARALNLSAMTVSRVLNQPEGVSVASDTRARVLQAAAGMGYRPNRHARALATGRTHTIALWISHLHSSVYTQIARSCREEIERAGLQAAICEMHWHFPAPGAHPRFDWQVDGILAVDPPSPDALAELLDDAVLSRIPRVNLGSARTVEWSGDSVRVDLGRGTREAVAHLVRAGCHRIAYSLPQGGDAPGSGNYEAYLDVLQEAGLPPEPIFHARWTMESVRADIRAHVAALGPPGGLYCHNDELAIAAFRALRDMGLRIPADVLLIGCEGNEFMDYFDPPLSTVSLPVEAMCHAAWGLLHQRLQSPDAPPQRVLLPHKFLQRESSARGA